MKGISIQTATLVAVILAAAIPPVGLAGATQSRGQSNTEAITQVLMDLQRQEDEAEAQNDKVALDRILADDFFTMEPDGRVVSKAEYLARIGSTVSASITLDRYADVAAHVYGDMAIVNYRVRFLDRKDGGTVQAQDFRVTVVWVKQGAAWRTATFHSYSLQP